MCLMCPPPVATHVLSHFVKLLMALLMGSWGKSSQINSNAIFNSFIVFGFSCSLWYFSNIASSKALIRDLEHVWLLVVDTLNTCCDIGMLLGKKIGLCYVMLRHMFLKRQNQWGGLIKSYITFVPFEIFWWNLAVICKNELPLSLYNFIQKY